MRTLDAYEWMHTSPMHLDVCVSGKGGGKRSISLGIAGGVEI